MINNRAKFDTTYCISTLSLFLKNLLIDMMGRKTGISIVCIGTDRSTGDSYGPFVGSLLLDRKFDKKVNLYGTLDEPVMATNIKDTISILNKNHLVIAIDACLGRKDSVGYIDVKNIPMQPGSGVHKDLPTIGDISVGAVVNVGGFMEYMVLQNTRLSLVKRMAEITADIIEKSVNNYYCYYNRELDKKLNGLDIYI